MTDIAKLKEAMEKATPGEWTLVQPNHWPFAMWIESCDRTLFASDRYATSTKQNTLSDCMSAVGFKGRERERVVKLLNEQVANHDFIVLAHNLLPGILARYEKMEEALKLSKSLRNIGFNECLSSLSADELDSTYTSANEYALEAGRIEGVIDDAITPTESHDER